MINASKLQKQNKDEIDTIDDTDNVVNDVIQGFYFIMLFYVKINDTHSNF